MFPTQSDGSSIDLERSIFEPLFENPLILDDLNADYAALDGNEARDNGVKKRQRMSSSVTQIYENNDDVSKKTMHRDIERQRRQEMANLYASLRFLLPLEYVKGKRSVSDHMHEAVNYIKDIRKNIDEMKIMRDRLKKSRGSRVRAGVDSEDVYFVKVNPCRDGAIEVLIGSSVNEESFPLSKVLVDLFGRGLNVITCVSTRGHQCSLHKLEIELNETTSVDLSELQDRLVNLIKLA